MKNSCCQIYLAQKNKKNKKINKEKKNLENNTLLLFQIILLFPIKYQ